MNERQLNQNIGIQLDPNSDVLTRITGYERRDALKRTTINIYFFIIDYALCIGILYPIT